MKPYRTLLDYEISHRISESKTTVTDLAKGPDGWVYLKTLKSYQASPADVAKLRNEFETQRRIGVATLKEHEGFPVLVVSAHEGASHLEQVLDGHPLPIRDFLKIAIPLSEALAAVHETGIVHKDINPKNIMVSKKGEAQIINFEFSSCLEIAYQESKTVATLEGTLAYISPEQTQRMNRPTDYRTDLYSLGVVFYQMLTGVLPFISDDPMDLIYSHIARKPVSPNEISAIIPEVVSNITMKLLSKNAEDRYNSGFGLKRDLEACFDRLTSAGMIESFEIGQHDISRRLNIPQKLYGRTAETEKLMRVFETAASGPSQLALVSGYSGIGKTVLVNELQKPVTGRKGFFISGKFDQFQNQAPYSAIAQAVTRLVQGLLSESPDKIEAWRESILQAVGINGQLMIDIIPDLESIIGVQQAGISLGLIETKIRFQRVFQSFMSVFSKPEHPLVLFLDDLQWVDPGSLDLLKVMLAGNSHLCIIGSYRDNEMYEDHPLMQMTNELKKTFTVEEIVLKPLQFRDLTELLSDTLLQPKPDCAELAQLILTKTGGNPFFVSEFLRQLFRERALKLNENFKWVWNVHDITKLNVTDNVIELMSKRIMALPARSQELLKLAACVGNIFDYPTVAAINKISLAQVIFNLSDAVREGLLISTGDFSNFENTARGVLSGAISPEVLADLLKGSQCRFLHDRIQQACYELTSSQERSEQHFKIGRMLLAAAKSSGVEGDIIAIVNHMNSARDLLQDSSGRQELAGLNLAAAKKAKDGSAYQTAADYADLGLQILGADPWTAGNHSEYFELHIVGGECKVLLGQTEQAEAMLEHALAKANNSLEKGRIYAIRVAQLSTLGKFSEAVKCGIEGLREHGIYMPELNNHARVTSDFMKEYTIYRTGLQEQPIHDFYQLPVNESPEHIQVTRLLASMLASAIIGPSHYLGIVSVKLANLCIAKGNAPHAAIGYAWLGVVEIGLGNYDDAYDLGELSLRLSEEKFQNNLLLGALLDTFATFHSFLKRPSRDSYPFWERAYTESLNAGGLLSAVYAAINGARQSIIWNASSLPACDEFMSKQMVRINQLSNPAMSYSIRSHLGFVRSLRGMTAGLDSTDFEDYSEAAYRQAFAGAPLLITLVENFRIILNYISGDYQSALKTLANVDFTSIETFIAHAVEYRFFGALTYAALYHEASAADQIHYLGNIRHCYAFLEKVAASCPENFRSIERLIAAEIANIENASLEEVLALYEEAIAYARANGFINFNAIACERAGVVCQVRGHRRIASVYIRESHAMFTKWGAVAKVKIIEAKYPELFFDTEKATHVQTGSQNILTSQGLDLSTALKAAQTMSGEIVQERLLIKMMKTMLECGGAQVAILALDNEQGETIVRVRAEATSTELLHVPLEEYSEMCLGAVRFVQRTQQIVSLDDASRDERFSPDPYVRKHQLKSVLCLPVQSQGRLLGYLYMENNLAERAFNDDRVALLEMLASQAAISLENSALYANMEQRVLDRTQELNRSLENLKAAQAQLANSSKMSALGQMAGGIAHEINTPLAIVQLQAEMLKDLVLETPLSLNTINIGLDTILTTAERVAKIIVGLRTFSRDGSHDAFENTSIRALFDQTLALCSERFHKNEVQVDLANIDPLAFVPCRGTEISQVILNLFNNAYDAIESLPERWIKVSITESAKDYKIAITDSGSGIPEHAREKLFEPFFTTKPIGKGTGLGLSISQGILRKHGGDLYLETASKNTCFVIQLMKIAPQNEKAA